MNPEIAKAAMTFLERVQLQGNEAPAFLQVMQALSVEANPAPVDDGSEAA